jgi:hypothetical protein
MSAANLAILDYCSLISLNLTLLLNQFRGESAKVPSAIRPFLAGNVHWPEVNT